MTSKKCWTITGHFPGMKSQVLGLAEAIGLPTDHKTCVRKWPWGWIGLPLGNPLAQLTSDSDSLTPPWPDLLITCGRRSAPFGLAIKKKSGGKTFCVHIQDPLFYHDHFDLIVAPRHDNLKGSNVILTEGALHKVTPEKIEQGLAQNISLFQGLKPPFNVVLVGGSTHSYKMSLEAVEDLIRTILLIREKTGGSVLVTPSFRTPFRQRLREAFASEPQIFLADIEVVNPYLAMLGIADTLFVTGDSVNMVCEACSTGKPVYILPLLGFRKAKSLTFIQELIKKGIVRLFEGKVEKWAYTPFNDTIKIAEILKKKLFISS